MIYCVDTSSLIAAWQERYPIENFPKFWDRMDGLIVDGRLVSPVEVFNEIKKRSDELHGWLKSRKDSMFRSWMTMCRLRSPTSCSDFRVSWQKRNYERLLILSL
jgi:hypothetical protein